MPGPPLRGILSPPERHRKGDRGGCYHRTEKETALMEFKMQTYSQH